MTHSPIRVLITDDHKVLREGLRLLLNNEPDLTVVAEAADGQQAIEIAGDVQPDVIVMDIGMEGMNGLEAIKILREQQPQVRIVVLSMHKGREMVMQAIEAGCDGYVPKSAAHINLVNAIRTVYAGQRFLDPTAATAVLNTLVEKEQENQLLTILSDRELEVLRFTALGYTSREIGLQLSLSPKTIDTYRQRAMEKLNLSHRAELVQFALRAGLLNDLR
jgi:two-component system response regulator NreC